MKKMRTALVGLGMRAREAVIPTLKNMDEIELSVVCDVWDENIQKALTLINDKPEVISDYTDLFHRNDIDAIILVTPNYLHADMAEAILKSGKPLYLEKPMSIKLADCERLERCAIETGTPVMIGMQLRYADIYRKMREKLDSGTIGKLRMMNYTQFRSPLRGGWENWRLDSNRSGGSILEVTVHHMDLFNWFAGGKTARVSAFAGRETLYSDINMWDEGVLILEYDNGVRADIEFSLFAPVAIERNGLYLLGDKAVMYHQGKKIIIKEFGANGHCEEIDTLGLESCDELAYSAFYNLVLNEGQVLTSPEAGKRAVIAGLAAEKSILEGRAVSFSEIGS